MVDASIDAYPKPDTSSGAGAKGDITAQNPSSSASLLGGLGLLGSSSSASAAAAPVRKASIADRDTSEEQKVSIVSAFLYLVVH